MIKIENLHKEFESTPILKGVNLEVKQGEILALIGGSGNGKTVLLKTIIGLLKPDSGHIFLDGQDINAISTKELNIIKDRFGIVFQSSALFDSLNVFENIAFPLAEKTKLNKKEIAKKVSKALDQVDLKQCEKKYPSQISGGMQKRVAIARCLVTNPKVILFDEPTTGLDPIIRKTIHQLIARLQKECNITALIVTHEIPQIFDIANKVAMLHEGQIYLVTTPRKFVNSTDANVKRFLSGEIE